MPGRSTEESGQIHTKRTGKRDLATDLSEGMEALADERHGKRTLRHHSVEFKPAHHNTAATDSCSPEPETFDSAKLTARQSPESRS